MTFSDLAEGISWRSWLWNCDALHMLKADRRHAGGGSLGRWIIAHVRARWFWRLTRMSAYNNPCLCHIRNQTAPEAFSFVAWRKLCGRKLHDIFGSRRGDKLAFLIVELHVGRCAREQDQVFIACCQVCVFELRQLLCGRYV